MDFSYKDIGYQSRFFPLLVKRNDSYLHLLDVNVDPNKKEAFFHFKSPIFNKKAIVNQHQYNGEVKQFSIPDHISFHNDGSMHVRTKKKGKGRDKVFPGSLRNNLYDFAFNEYIPLFFCSYLITEKLEKQYKKHAPINKGCFWEIDENSKHLTVIVFLTSHQASLKVFNELSRTLDISEMPVSLDMGDHCHQLMFLRTDKMPKEYLNGYLNSNSHLLNGNETWGFSTGYRPSLEILANDLVKMPNE